jgi:transcriptional regulator with XRE-family HTH domain
MCENYALASLFVMCEQKLMSTPPKYSELAQAAGISRSYASEIVSGVRQPSRPLAIHILRKTGWRHSVLADLSDAQIDVLESVEPWGRAA